MEFIPITTQNVYLLETFFYLNTYDTFRYYHKRTFDAIKNHMYTIIVKLNNELIGYAHIDYDNDKYWFGICIINEFQGKGLGNKIMDYIFNHNKIKDISEIYLSVDKDNYNAIQLYKKHNFNIIDQSHSIFFMKKILFNINM